MYRAATLLITYLTLATACGQTKDDDSASSAEDDAKPTQTDTAEDDGDTDTDTGDDETDVEDADTDQSDGDTDGAEDVGPDDIWAQMGCEQMEAEPEVLTLGANSSEANTAVVIADEEGVWTLEMPPSGDGWFVVEIPDWMTVMHVFTNEGIELEIINSDPFTDALINGACPDAGITDQRFAFHEWGAYTVRVDETAPETVWFSVAKED